MMCSCMAGDNYILLPLASSFCIYHVISRYLSVTAALCYSCKLKVFSTVPNGYLLLWQNVVSHIGLYPIQQPVSVGPFFPRWSPYSDGIFYIMKKFMIYSYVRHKVSVGKLLAPGIRRRGMRFIFMWANPFESGCLEGWQLQDNFRNMKYCTWI